MDLYGYKVSTFLGERDMILILSRVWKSKDTYWIPRITTKIKANRQIEKEF